MIRQRLCTWSATAQAVEKSHSLFNVRLGLTESCQKLSNSVSADEVDVHVDLDSIVVVSAPVIGAPLRSDISGVGIARTDWLINCARPGPMLLANCPLHTGEVCNQEFRHN